MLCVFYLYFSGSCSESLDMSACLTLPLIAESLPDPKVSAVNITTFENEKDPFEINTIEINFLFLFDNGNEIGTLFINF